MDSLLDIGGETEFPFLMDWSTNPINKFQITRNLFEYRGTASKIEQQNPETPINVEADFYFENKEAEYTFLDFIHGRIGKTKRFWLRHPKQMFRLTEGVSNGSVVMRCEPNNFDLFHVGHERIYIEMNTGDTLTRHVENATYDSVNEELNLEIASAIDRSIDLTNYYIIGRYYLMRFDVDAFRLKIISNTKSQISLRFVEVIRDYDALAAD